MDSWDAYHNFIFGADIERWTKILARYELFKKTIDVPGDIIECGVWRGAGLLLWARLIDIFCPNSGKKVIGFDTFEGFPASNWAKEDEFVASFYDESGTPPTIYDVMETINQSGLSERIELIRGKFNPNRESDAISLLNIDFDIGDPTIEAMTRLGPLVSKGGVIVYDDYGLDKTMATSFINSIEKRDIQTFSWARSPGGYVEV